MLPENLNLGNVIIYFKLYLSSINLCSEQKYTFWFKLLLKSLISSIAYVHLGEVWYILCGMWRWSSLLLTAVTFSEESAKQYIIAFF